MAVLLASVAWPGRHGGPELRRHSRLQRQADPHASVVMHPVEKNGKQSKADCNQADPDGKASFDGVLTASCESRCWPGSDFGTTTPSTNINGDHGQDEAASGAIFHL